MSIGFRDTTILDRTLELYKSPGSLWSSFQYKQQVGISLLQNIMRLNLVYISRS
jgi:hypothetical protein